MADSKIREIQSTERIQCITVDFEGGEGHMQGLESSLYELKVTPANSQQGAGDLSPTATRNWFLSTTWINLQVDPPSEFTESNTGLPALDFAPVKPRRIQAQTSNLKWWRYSSFVVYICRNLLTTEIENWNAFFCTLSYLPVEISVDIRSESPEKLLKCT